MRKLAARFVKRLERPYDTFNRIEVSGKALRHNLHQFQKLSGLQVIPVLKGNAYGHGIAQVATALRREGLTYIAVDGYYEALAVRQVSRQPVLVMGAIKPANFKRMRHGNFAFVVQHIETVKALGATARPYRLHLEISTGMNRYGVEGEELTALVREIKRHPRLTIEGIMTHLADSDGRDPETVHAAVRRFDAAVDQVRELGAEPTMIHVAQTAGSVVAQSTYATAIRLGIGLYGINPYVPGHARHGDLAGLRPALRLISTIAKVNEVKAGESVSYNYTYTATKPTRVGVLPIGYYEGLDRALSSAGSATAGSQRLPIVGRVCMNHTMIDLGKTGLHEGDQVVLIDDDPSVDNCVSRIAELHNLFDYRLLTSLSKDIRRVIVD